MKKDKTKFALVGLLGIIIILATYWGFNYLKGTNLFKKTNSYYVVYNRVDGLMTSATITVNGFKIGQVDKIELMPGYSGLIRVEFSIIKDIKIPLKSKARIYSMDLMGTKGIELIFEPSDKFHKPGDRLDADIEKSLREEVSYQMIPLKNQIEGLIGEVQVAVEVITYIFNPETRENLERSFESIRNTFAHLETSAGTLDTLFIDQSKKINNILNDISIISSDITNSFNKVEKILENLSEFTDSLVKTDIKETLNQANLALTNINSVVYRINKGEGTLGALINDDKLYKELSSASENLDRLLVDFRLNPKKYINFSVMSIGRTINVSDESELSKRDLKRLERQRKKDEEMIQKELEKDQKNN